MDESSINAGDELAPDADKVAAERDGHSKSQYAGQRARPPSSQWNGAAWDQAKWDGQPQNPDESEFN